MNKHLPIKGRLKLFELTDPVLVASAKASSVVTVASAVSEEVPSLVGAVGLTSSRSTAPRHDGAESRL